MDQATFNKANELVCKIIKYENKLQMLESEVSPVRLELVQAEVGMGDVAEICGNDVFHDVKQLIINSVKQRLVSAMREFEML